MPVEKIVINASPLILLCNCELEGILPKPFSDVVIPEAVREEIIESLHRDRAAQMFPDLE